ncbi:MAG: hypothetical protein U9Q18_01555, partial [Caldisericota bacterium]|nr:hypothetical protein [Caldisericota bacterium]
MFNHGESVHLAGYISLFTLRHTRNGSGSLTLSLPGSVTEGGKAMMDYFKRHLGGHIRYYGVSGNYRQLKAYA